MKSFGIILFLFLILLTPLSSKTLSGTSQNSFQLNNLTDKKQIVKENIPVIDTIVFNQTQKTANILVAFMNHFEIYLLNRESNSLVLELNKTFGLNQTNYLWSIKLFQNNFISALSNGSIFSFNTAGTMNWSNKFSNLTVSDINILDNGLFVAISDSGEIFWFNPNNGSIVKTFYVPSTYFTLSKSYKNIIVAGNNNGTIFVFNSTQSIYNKSIGSANQQVLSLAINDNYLLAYCYNSSLKAFNPTTGQSLSLLTFSGINYDSLFLNKSILYFTKTDGSLNRLDLRTNVSILSLTPLYINQILTGDFTGDGKANLISFSDLGYVYILNENNTEFTYEEKISQGSISSASELNINNDGIVDFALGTQNGEFILLLGKDLTPPEIIPNSLSYNTTESSITISFSSNENITAFINYHKSGTYENSTVGNNNLSLKKSIKISDLQPETTYFVFIIIKDKAGNINQKTFLIIKTSPSPPPYLLYGSIGTILIIGAVGTSYYYQRRRTRTKAFEEAEKYYEAGEYILAIKAYIRANARERIIDLVAFLASNPQLSYFVDEIKQMEELNAYMVDIQEIIKDQKI